MKSIVLFENMPDDDCGSSWKRWAIINEEHCYSVNQYWYWEDGDFMDSASYPVDDDLYKFVVDKIIDFLENINGYWQNFENLGYSGDYIYYCYAIHDSEKNSNDPIPDENGKESKIINFVENFVDCHEERIDFDNLDEKYRDLFEYIHFLSDKNIFDFSDDYFEDVLEDLSFEDLKKKIIEEWK